MNWSWEGLEWELSCATTHCQLLQTGRQYFPSSTGRCLLLFYSNSNKEKFLTYEPTQAMKDCYNSSNEKPLYFEFLVSSNRLFVYNSPSKFPVSSIKSCWIEKRELQVWVFVHACTLYSSELFNFWDIKFTRLSGTHHLHMSQNFL